MQQHQIEVDGTTITVSSHVYQSLLLLTQASELSKNSSPNSYAELHKMLVQAAHLLQEEGKDLEEEKERVLEDAVPKPHNAEKWMEAQARENFVIQDLKRCKNGNELISLFNRAFRSGDSVACYLIHRNSMKWFEYHKDLSGYSDYLHRLKELYPAYQIADEARDKREDIYNRIADEILGPLVREALNEKDGTSVFYHLMGWAKEVFIEKVAEVLKCEEPKVDMNARLLDNLGNAGVCECIAIAEEVWGIRLIPCPIEPSDYAQVTKTFPTLNVIVSAAEAEHKAKYEC